MPTPRLTPASPGVVVLERRDRAPYQDPNHRVSVVTERKTVKYGVRANGAIFLNTTLANHYKGRARFNNPKSFSRWALDHAVSIDAVAGKPWTVSTLSPKTGWKNAIVFAETDLANVGASDLRQRALDLLPPAPSMWDYYPLLSHYLTSEQAALAAGPYGNPATSWAPAEIRRAFAQTTTVQDLTRLLFGKTRYRRDLVKAVAQTTIPSLAFAWQLRGLVPIDWLVTLMNQRPLRNGYRCAPHVRPHLRDLDRQSLRNLTRDHEGLRYLRDIVRFRPGADIGRVRTWRDLHDRLVDHTLIYRGALTKDGKPRKRLTLPDYAAALTQTPPGAFTIQIASHEDDLWAWATEMRHCIGGYGRAMRSGYSLLGAARDEAGRLIGNFEVTVRPTASEGPPALALTQFLGHRNTLVPEDFRDLVTDHLAAHGVAIPKKFWGSERVAGRVEAA